MRAVRETKASICSRQTSRLDPGCCCWPLVSCAPRQRRWSAMRSERSHLSHGSGAGALSPRPRVAVGEASALRTWASTAKRCGNRFGLGPRAAGLTGCVGGGARPPKPRPRRRGGRSGACSEAPCAHAERREPGQSVLRRCSCRRGSALLVGLRFSVATGT